MKNTKDKNKKPYILSNDNSKTENEVKALVVPPPSLLLVLVLWFFISRWAIPFSVCWRLSYGCLYEINFGIVGEFRIDYVFVAI
ncbi:hypothetical protein GBA52_003301 [Prunus armeniaca]|nr:hypothetical protein GBA52_003301 [Prunus armeniaca]